MSDEQLPTAAIASRNQLDGNIDFTSILTNYLEDGDELVRRQDVVELVENNIEEKLEYYEEGNTPFDSYECSALRPYAKEVKEELLEEIEK